MIDPDWIAPLLRGLLITVLVFAGAAAIAALSGLALGVAGARGGPWLRATARVWVEAVRGTSAVVQLFWVVFALPLAGVPVDPLLGGVVVLGLNSGAYASEAVRGALLALPAGQRDAAHALRLDAHHRLLRIELPQILPVVLPTAGNLAVELLKNTSLVSLVGLADLTFQAGALRAATLADVPILVVLLALYVMLAQVLAWASRRGERACARWHRGLAA